MTIYDISEKAGVSIATVSRVLNGSNNVSEKTKKKVLDVINQYEMCIRDSWEYSRKSIPHLYRLS